VSLAWPSLLSFPGAYPVNCASLVTLDVDEQNEIAAKYQVRRLFLIPVTTFPAEGNPILRFTDTSDAHCDGVQRRQADRSVR
jgi:hypothetical protein